FRPARSPTAEISGSRPRSPQRYRPYSTLAGRKLSRDSPIDQRIARSLVVQGLDSLMDGSIEVGGVGEGVVGEIVRFEIVPDNLDVVEFGRIFRQPLDGEPMLARSEGGKGELADVDRSIVLDQHDRL